MDQVHALLTRQDLLATSEPAGLTAEFPVGPRPGVALPGGISALLRVHREANRPWPGRGLLLPLSLPVHAGGPRPLALLLQLHALERTALDRGYHLGSWALPLHAAAGTVVGHTLFLRGAVSLPGLLQALVMSVAARARAGRSCRARGSVSRAGSGA